MNTNLCRLIVLLAALAVLGVADAQQRQLNRTTLDTFGRAVDTAFNAGPLGAMCKIRGEENPKQYGLKEDHVALEVTAIHKGSPAQRARLAVGDFILAVDDIDFTLDQDPFYALVDAMIGRYSGKIKGPIKLKIRRRGQEGVVRAGFPSYGKNWEATLIKQSFARLGRLSTASRMSGNNSKVAINAVCGLAFLAGGYPTGKAGKYKGAVMSAGSGSGMMKRKGGPNPSQVNWALGYGSVLLAEWVKRTGDSGARNKLASMCRKIEQNQEENGGWAHGPGGPNALGYTDLAVVTDLCLAGYGGAGQCGIKLNPVTVKKGIAYLVKTSNNTGGVGYSVADGQRGLADPGKTAGGLMAFSTNDQRGHPFYIKMIEYLTNNLNNVLEGHASPMVHLQLSAIGYSMFPGGKHIFRDQFLREFLLGRLPDGSFTARPSKESKGGLNSDKTMGAAWATGSYLLAWSMKDSKLKLFSKDTGKDGGREPKKHEGEKTGQ